MLGARTARVATRLAARQPQAATQTVFRRNMSGHGEDIPGANVWMRSVAYGLGLGLAFGLAWKSWQWSDKAKRVENNNKWDKYYPIYANQVRADLEAADAAEAAENEPDVPVEKEENEDRPESDQPEAEETVQPLPGEKKTEGKYIPTKKNQQDL